MELTTAQRHTLPAYSRPLPWQSLVVPSVLFALPVALSCALILIAFYPGLMSPDSYEEWLQGHTWKILSWHPTSHIVFMGLLAKIADTPLIVAIVQSAALVALVSYSAIKTVQLSGKLWLGWIVAIVPAVAVQNALMAVTLWKDVPFSLALSAACIILCFAAFDRRPGYRPAEALLLGLLTAVIWLFRSNGFLPAILIVIAVAVIYQTWRMPFRTAACAAVLIFLVNGPVTWLLGAQYVLAPAGNWMALHVVAAHLNHGTPLTDAEREKINSIRPLDSWPYRCSAVSDLVFDGKLKPEIKGKSDPDFQYVALKLSLRNPVATVLHFGCASSFLWSPIAIRDPSNATFSIAWSSDGALAEFDHRVYKFDIDLPDRAAISKQLPLKEFINAITTPPSDMFFARPALWLFVLFIPAMILAVRRRPKPFIAILPVLVNGAAMGLASPGQDLRFYYYVMLTSVCLAPVLWWKVAAAKSAD